MKQINFDSQIMHLHKSPHGTMLKIRSLIGHFFSNSYIFIFQHSRTQTSFPYLLKTSSIYWFSLIFTFNCQNPCITLMFKYDSIYLHPESFLFSYAHHLLQKKLCKKDSSYNFSHFYCYTILAAILSLFYTFATQLYLQSLPAQKKHHMPLS